MSTNTKRTSQPYTYVSPPQGNNHSTTGANPSNASSGSRQTSDRVDTVYTGRKSQPYSSSTAAPQSNPSASTVPPSNPSASTVPPSNPSASTANPFNATMGNNSASNQGGLSQDCMDRVIDQMKFIFGCAKAPAAPKPPKPPVATTPEEKAKVTLGLPLNANIEDVKRAYKILVMKFHPDRPTPEGYTKETQAEKFKELDGAYKLLTGNSTSTSTSTGNDNPNAGKKQKKGDKDD